MASVRFMGPKPAITIAWKKVGSFYTRNGKSSYHALYFCHFLLIVDTPLQIFIPHASLPVVLHLQQPIVRPPDPAVPAPAAPLARDQAGSGESHKLILSRSGQRKGWPSPSRLQV